MPDAPVNDGGPAVTIVRACLRDGAGGSPTAVLAETGPTETVLAEPGLAETGLTDAGRRAVAGRAGTSHAVFVAAEDTGPGGARVSLRFFTATGELPACGHGTIAALAFLAARAGDGEWRGAVRTRGGVLAGRAARVAGHRFAAAFEPGPVELPGRPGPPGPPGPPEPPRPVEPDAGGYGAVLRALGAAPGVLRPGARVAVLGRPRLLVPVASRAALAALAPDFARLREACDRLDLLGCYVYSPPQAGGRLAARMFAPSIGVPEDIANANSTACLAAHLAGQGVPAVTADMGDALGAPATITAEVRPDPTGPRIHLGGTAAIRPAERR
ncbi:hypothetical protein Sru01_62790 [Sphaerisporangium rufum]|uniref:PhzF family phenazine biosynthesis protein n=1 Tax=Sphaerisporangium rufum TaxID=1381558 RepID=A0A919V3X4_9ACTN|nr:PhzF family phenazine biosynthesis protein [Sphaerisporangium rufum]GII81297.1 hypothetical protein Sru01_62790 [Sphaerisporangium rufum]